jgi:hypothetical protein
MLLPGALTDQSMQLSLTCTWRFTKWSLNAIALIRECFEHSMCFNSVLMSECIARMGLLPEEVHFGNVRSASGW